MKKIPDSLNPQRRKNTTVRKVLLALMTAAALLTATTLTSCSGLINEMIYEDSDDYYNNYSTITVNYKMFTSLDDDDVGYHNTTLPYNATVKDLLLKVNGLYPSYTFTAAYTGMSDDIRKCSRYEILDSGTIYYLVTHLVETFIDADNVEQLDAGTDKSDDISDWKVFYISTGKTYYYAFMVDEGDSCNIDCSVASRNAAILSQNGYYYNTGDAEIAVLRPDGTLYYDDITGSGYYAVDSQFYGAGTYTLRVTATSSGYIALRVYRD